MKRDVTILVVTCVWLGGCVDFPGGDGTPDPAKLLIFHNNSGPMCLEALEWLDTMASKYPTLTIEEHLTFQAGETALLAELEAPFEASQGVSTSFGYLPIIFFQEQAFSGFNEDVAEALEELILAATSTPP